MPQNRFFVDHSLPMGATLTLEEDEFHHLRVMRIAVGETLELVNGHGVLGEAKLISLDKKRASLILLSSKFSPRPIPSIHLAVPMMRLSKLEWIIEKGTELGADSFSCYRAHGSEKEELSLNQLDRLRSLSIAALKQSGRLYLPSLALFPNLASLLKQSKPTHLFFGNVGTQVSLPTSLAGDALLITGPERGFSSEELELLRTKGVVGVRLGPYILRAETAPIAGLSILGASKHFCVEQQDQQ